MFFIVSESVAFLLILILLLLLSGVWPPDSPWAPWWQMPQEVIVAICKKAKLTKKDIIYDLGCGTGKALVYATMHYPVKGVGIEIDPIRYFLARWNVWRFGQKNRIVIVRKNFFNVSFSKATVIFVYLVPAALKRLTPKFLSELRPGTKFFSFVYPMPQSLFKERLQLVEYDKVRRIYFYKLLAQAKK